MVDRDEVHVPSLRLARRDRVPLHRALEDVAVDGEVEMPAGHGKRERHAAFQPGHELTEERAIQAVELESRRLVNTLAGPLAEQLLWILVGVDGDTRGGLAGL